MSEASTHTTACEHHAQGQAAGRLCSLLTGPGRGRVLVLLRAGQPLLLLRAEVQVQLLRPTPRLLLGLWLCCLAGRRLRPWTLI